MLVSGLNSHPELGNVTHEFRGDESAFRANPGVLTNYWQPWMAASDIVKIHYRRNAARDGAESMLFAGYKFPHGFVMPTNLIDEVEIYRGNLDDEFDTHITGGRRLTYESLGGGAGTVTEFDAPQLCNWIDVANRTFQVETTPVEQKTVPGVRRNLEINAALSAAEVAGVDVTVPPGHSICQPVIDRQAFEDTTPDAPLYYLRIIENGHARQARQRGGPVEMTRPGRKPWTWVRWPIEPATTSVRIEVEAIQPFTCMLDVDFLE